MPTTAFLTCVHSPQLPYPNLLHVPVSLLPLTIPSLFQPGYKELTNDNLWKKCRDVFIGLGMILDKAAYLVKETKLQSKSLVWFEHRRAWITASKFHTACHTSITSPSWSLVKQILTVGGSVTSTASVGVIKAKKLQYSRPSLIWAALYQQIWRIVWISEFVWLVK